MVFILMPLALFISQRFYNAVCSLHIHTTSCGRKWMLRKIAENISCYKNLKRNCIVKRESWKWEKTEHEKWKLNFPFCKVKNQELFSREPCCDSYLWCYHLQWTNWDFGVLHHNQLISSTRLNLQIFTKMILDFVRNVLKVRMVNYEWMYVSFEQTREVTAENSFNVNHQPRRVFWSIHSVIQSVSVTFRTLQKPCLSHSRKFIMPRFLEGIQYCTDKWKDS